MENLEEEIWKDIPGYEGYYQCSSYGLIKSLKRIVSNRKSFRIKKQTYLTPSLTQGYKRVILHKDGKAKSFAVHQLVAICFHGHIPCGYKIVVDHIDNDRLNNFYKNLQLISQRENATKDRKNKSGLTGVSLHKGVWKSEIAIKGKTRYIGAFKTKEQAYENYIKAIKNINKFNGNITEFRKEINTHKETTSNQKGVSYNQKDKVWTANYFKNKKRIHLGSFKTEIEAIKARLEAYENKLKQKQL